MFGKTLKKYEENIMASPAWQRKEGKSPGWFK
jgi:hypothetical protein